MKRSILFMCAVAVGLQIHLAGQELPSEMAAGWEAYIAENDRQIAEADAGSDAFLSQDVFDDPVSTAARASIARGDIFTTKITLVHDGRFPMQVPDALAHHWMGAVWVPGATLDEVLAFVQDFDSYPDHFADVQATRVLEQDGDAFRVFIRTRRQQVITVHYNTEHDIQFERHGPRRASQRAVVTKIAELDNAGEPDEREKAFGDDQTIADIRHPLPRAAP